MKRFKEEILSELRTLKEKSLLRRMEILNSGDFPSIIVGKKKFVNFSSNNYLGLNGHWYIKKEMISALEKWGTSASASRLISGNLEIFEIAEKELANFKKKESCLFFNSGYQANLSVISTLMKEKDAIFSDELNHASIIDGCRLSKADVHVYPHNDIDHLEKLLKRSKATKRLIVTDGVFSMDGDIVDLPALTYLANKYDAMILLDDAHATGILGENGRGTEEYFNIKSDSILIIGTGGKALGVGGAFFCGPKYIRDYLINKCRGFIFSTALPPTIPAGIVASIKILDMESWRRERLKALSSYFFNRLREIGFFCGKSPSHITPLVLGDSRVALNVEKQLRKSGIFARAIRYPSVPEGTARIRFALTAEHTEEDIDRVVEVLKIWKEGN